MTISTNPPVQLNDPSLWITNPGFLDGKWTALPQHETFDITNPATGEVIGKLPDMTVADTRDAIAAADKAFQTYSKTSPQQRAAILESFYRLTLENKDDLAKLITLENGKSKTDATVEAGFSAGFLQWNAGEALRLYGKVIPSAFPNTKSWTQIEPLGVVAALCPWNFPPGMVARKVAAALAVGCTSVIKVPAETPFSVLAFVELARRAGVPPGVIQVITTDKNLVPIGEELCTNPAVKKVSFTGSTRVGKLLMQHASGTLKHLSMELGGNAPFIVFEDADIDVAVKGTLVAKYRCSGQTCVCANRIYVHESIYDKYSAALAAAVDKLVVGDGSQDGVNMGPLVHKAAVEKCQRHVDDAVKRGAKILTKPRPKREGKLANGNFFDPVVLGDAPADCLVADEETFGPVAALIKFKTEEEVIRLANNTDMGLAAYFYTKSQARTFRVADQLQAGMVGVNSTSISHPTMPFGGFKESGFGKEGGPDAILDYVQVKTVTVNIE
ncbi:hypothetical protein Q8F55_005473 [Vanrija albida]|uniref:Aldehyde dehydrogenase domain-containing protein n=1 Tax=Vanrija albida TaxID=181172 RepID=A0ABR3Q1R1_9TREE